MLKSLNLILNVSTDYLLLLILVLVVVAVAAVLVLFSRFVVRGY